MASPKRRSYRGKKSKRSNRKSGKKSGKKSGGCLRLTKLRRSPKPEKKWRAEFSDGSHRDFGARGMSDYTLHGDKARMERYNARHKKNENWNDLKSPGALSKYVLWSKPSLRGGLREYKRRLSAKCIRSR
jgi:hypothetical protein